MTQCEPEWTDEDRGWVLALLAEQRETCRGCGHPLSECRDEGTMYGWHLETSTCQACLILEADADNQAEKRNRPRGRYVAAVRNSS